MASYANMSEIGLQLFSKIANKNYPSSDIRREIQGSDIASIKDANGAGPLHIASGYGRTSLVLFLIAKGCDVNSQDNEGQAPLHYACCHAHSKTAEKLIEADAKVDLTDHKGWTPMHIALNRDENRKERISPPYWKLTQLLLSFGADPYIESNAGKSCFYWVKDCDQRRHIRIFHSASKAAAEEDLNLRYAIVDKYLQVQDFFELVKMGDDEMDILELLWTPRLHQARLADCDNITPLHRAAGHNHLKVASFFISNGANVNDVDEHGRIPLHNAAQYGHTDMIELLIENGSDINKQDLGGRSPLHVAAPNKTFPACLKLIELGADVYLRTSTGELPYDLAESEDVREVLKPECLKHRIEMIPSSSDQAIYIGIQEDAVESPQKRELTTRSLPDELMLDSSSGKRLFSNTNYTIKKITLNEYDWRFQLVKDRMLGSIAIHADDSGGKFKSYEIISIELILNEKVWSKYRLMCQRLEIDYGKDFKNERMLFHGSNFIDKIQSHGFDERYAQRDGMFGAGLYFADHSSKSNQYTFGWGNGCQDHKDKSCYTCERKMIYAQVALGKSLISKEPINCAHAPPGYSSVTGSPETIDNLAYPEYAIYSGDQAYPLFVIRYRIKR